METRIQRFYRNHPERRRVYNVRAAVNLLIRSGFIVTDAQGAEMVNSAGKTGTEYQRSLAPDVLAAIIREQAQLLQLQD